MPKYKVIHDYRSNHNGRYFAYDEGNEAEVDEQVAEWVNRDSPGTLEPADAKKKSTSRKTSSSRKAADEDDG